VAPFSVRFLRIPDCADRTENACPVRMPVMSQLPASALSLCDQAAAAVMGMAAGHPQCCCHAAAALTSLGGWCCCCCRYFQELDFPWAMDVELVLQLIPAVIQIVTEEAQKLDRTSAARAAGSSSSKSNPTTSSSSTSPKRQQAYLSCERCTRCT